MNTRYIDRYLAFFVALATGFVVIVMLTTTVHPPVHKPNKVSFFHGQTHA